MTTLKTADPDDGMLASSTKAFGRGLMEYLPPALAVGGAGAGLVYLASRIAQHRSDLARREKARAGSNDVLTVEIPHTKSAGVLDVIKTIIAGAPRMAGRALNATSRGLDDMAQGVTQVVSATAKSPWTVPKAIIGLPKSRTRQTATAIALAGGGAIGANELSSRYLGQGPALGTTVVGGVKDIASYLGDKGTQIAAGPSPKEEGPPGGALMGPALWLGGSVLGTTLGYGAVKDYMHSQQKKEEQQKLDKAKAEYSSLLGQSLSGPKLAAIAEWPTLEGLIAGLAEQFNAQDKTASNGLADQSAPYLMVGAVGALATLAGIVGHNYVYNRETAADEAMKDRRIKPPVSIRLISAPAPRNEEAEAAEHKLAHMQAEVLDYILKEASIIPMLSDSQTVMSAINSIKVPPKETDQDRIDGSAVANAELVDANTVIIHTAAGPIEVNASDPRAREVLLKRKQQLADTMASAIAMQS